MAVPNDAAQNDRRRSPIARFAGTIMRGRRLPAPLRNAPFALFLGAILAYGGLFAWYMLDRFDLINLLRDVNGDDSFYYFQIARNMAEGKFSTFDGGITRTNGYHPIWLFLITPFYWVFDPERALFAIKAFEIMLAAGGVAFIVLAARLARLPWILLFALLPMLYRQHVFFGGMESAAGLFMLGMFFLSICLFAREPARWTWPLAAAAFALPWVRLEFAAVSVAATAALWLIERSYRKRMPGASSVLRAGAPLLGASSGILAYFAYNRLVFGGALPVSGVARQVFSQSLWAREGGYNLAQNFQDTLRIDVFDFELLIALEICAYFLLAWRLARRARGQNDRLLPIFLAGAFGLAAGHLAKFVQTALTVDPVFGSYSHYFVPAYLMTALAVPIRCYVAIHVVRRFVEAALGRAARIPRLGIVSAAAVVLFMQTDFAYPFRYVERVSESSWRDWEISSYGGTQVMNRMLPEDSVVGSWDAGVIGYFSRFPVVNLDGVVNSYEYMRLNEDMRPAQGKWWILDPRSGGAEFFRRKFGITHFANAIEFSDIPDTGIPNALLFAGSPSSDDGEYGFRLWSAAPPEIPSAGIDPVNRFWERMTPHFDYESENSAVVIDGNLAQAFAKDCAPAEMRGELLVFSWLTEGGETVSQAWRPWETAVKNRLGFCVAAFELPNDAVTPVRIERMSANDYLARLRILAKMN